MSTTATLSPAVESSTATDEARLGGERYIPLHKLTGEARVWADRLLRAFRERPCDGVEWSLKFSPAGLVGNRFTLYVLREHWNDFDLANLSRTLAVPQSLWLRIQRDMEHSRAMLVSYEPNEGAGTYRIYLELMHAPEALRREGALPLGCGYKWDPSQGRELAVTAYRMRYLPTRDAFEDYLRPYLARLSNPVLDGLARGLIEHASGQADPCNFMFLEVGEAASRRDSFAVTFRGTDIGLGAYIPELLRLAGSLALPEHEVLDCFVPDEPRRISNVGAGQGRDGRDFLTIYYD